MRPTSKILHKEIISICSTADLCISALPHEETREHIDTRAKMLSQEELFPKSAPAHQNDGFQTELIPLNQSISVFLEDNIAIYYEAAKIDDHEEGEEILSQKNPKLDSWSKEWS